MAGTTPGWHRVFQSSKSGYFLSLAAISRRNIWAAAYLTRGSRTVYRPYVVHFNGRTWQSVSIPRARMASSTVQATSARDVWVFGLAKTSNDVASSAAYRWDGAHWRKIPVPAYTDFQGTAVLGPSNVWAFGGSLTLSGDVFHWNGRAWKSYSLNFSPQSVSASSSHNVWLAGMKRSGNRYRAATWRWNGRRWLRVAAPHPVVDSGPSVTVVSPSNVWMGWNTATRSHAEHWNGRRWTEVTPPRTLDASPLITPDGRGGYWFGPFADWTGHAWISTSDVSPSYEGGGFGAAVRIPRTSSSLVPAGVMNTGSSTEHPTIYRINLA